MLLLDDPEIVVSQTQIDCECTRNAVTVLRIECVRILKSIPICVPGILRTARRRPRKKLLETVLLQCSGDRVVHVIEDKSASKRAIENLGDRGPAELITK